MQSDKAQVVSLLSPEYATASEVIDNKMGVPSVLLTVEMCVVNMVTKTAEMPNVMI